MSKLAGLSLPVKKADVVTQSGRVTNRDGASASEALQHAAERPGDSLAVAGMHDVS
jgi:hypothetical protein